MQTGATAEDELISTTQAAELLGIDRSAVTRLAAAGTLPVAWSAPGPRGAKSYRRVDVDAVKAQRARN